MVQQIHKRDKTISAWTINRDEDASNMLSLGVDDVITDKPAMVQDLLREDAELDDDLLLIAMPSATSSPHRTAWTTTPPTRSLKKPSRTRMSCWTKPKIL